MSERLEELLRKAAQICRNLGNHTAEGMFLEAADAITELRGALLVASIDYRHLSEENAKLRDLVRHLYECMCNIDADGNHECYSCEYDNAEGECDFERLMRELGVGVDK